MYANLKMIPVETILGMGVRWVKENGVGVNSSVIHLLWLRTFVNATMYPHQHNN
jgi:hypothetical protein